MTTGLLYDPVFLEHETSQGHPECRERLEVSIQHLKQQSWFGSLTQLSPRAADMKWIRSVHSFDYIERAKTACLSGNYFLDSVDVSICPESFNIARKAVGAVLEIADKVINKEIDNGLALIRPPGHHAEQDQALGFCLFNNVAILAKYLQKQYQLDKILILDWDVHHGNGTQHTFEADPSVLYISTHQYPFYPGTGAYSETGIHKGAGATLNCPMPAGASDSDYELAFKDQILPRIDEFKPDYLGISSMSGEVSFYQNILEIIKQIFEDKNVLYGTQSIFSEGISLDILSCLILGTPVNNEPLLTQLIGRIIRTYDGKKQPTVVDVHLVGNTAKRQANARLGYYIKQGYEVSTL